MNLIYIQFLGLIPALLIFWIGSRVRASIPEDQRGTRWFRFLLITLLALLTILMFLNPDFNRVTSFIWQMAMPVGSGVLAIILFQIFSDTTIRTKDNLITLFLFLITFVLIILLGIIVGDGFAPLLFALSGILIGLTWWMRERFGKKYMLVGAIQILLLGVSVWSADTNHRLIESPRWLSTIVQIAVFFIPAISIGIAGLLVFDIISGNLSNKKYKILFGVILILFTVSFLGYEMYLTSIWDVTTDGLGAPFLWMLAGIASISAAMLMAWLLSGWRKLAALAFAVLMPLSLKFPHWIGTYGPDGEWGDSPTCITERRAEKVAQAVQNYFETHGFYPETLKDLFPQQLFYIPRPIMIPGQTWCYEGGQDFYRLGYVHRQYFSSPTSVRIHISSGEPPDEYWPCEAEAAKYPGPFGYPGP